MNLKLLLQLSVFGEELLFKYCIKANKLLMSFILFFSYIVTAQCSFQDFWANRGLVKIGYTVYQNGWPPIDKSIYPVLNDGCGASRLVTCLIEDLQDKCEYEKISKCEAVVVNGTQYYSSLAITIVRDLNGEITFVVSFEGKKYSKVFKKIDQLKTYIEADLDLCLMRL